MQCTELQPACTTGTQTQLGGVNRDDILVSWTSTYTLLSSTFSQFLVEISRLLQLPLNEGSPLLTLHFEKLLTEFKDKSMELHNMRESFEQSQNLEHSAHLEQSRSLDQNMTEEIRDVRTPELSFHSPLIKTPSPPHPIPVPVKSQITQFSTPLLEPISLHTTPLPLPVPMSLPSPCLTSQRPVVPIPAKIIQELPDSTNAAPPPLKYTDNSIKISVRSAFFRPTPKPDSTMKSEPVSPASSSSTHSSTSSALGSENKSDSELFDCLQKLQHCYDKYFSPPDIKPLISDYKPVLPDYKPILPDYKPIVPDYKPIVPNYKPIVPDYKTFHNALLFNTTNPLVLSAINRQDPALIIKAMQETNPLLAQKTQKHNTSRLYMPYTNNNPDTPMKCPYCELTFHKKSHLSNHLVQLHSHSYHCCRQCKISFPDKMSLEKHQQSHPKQQFQCSGCNLSFKTGSELKRHIKTHTQERAFMCDICGSRFNLKHNLKAHMRQHTGERPFRCKICNRGFTRSNNLKRHIYGHCQDESFVKSALQNTISPQSMMLKSTSMLQRVQSMSPMLSQVVPMDISLATEEGIRVD